MPGPPDVRAGRMGVFKSNANPIGIMSRTSSSGDEFYLFLSMGCGRRRIVKQCEFERIRWAQGDSTRIILLWLLVCLCVLLLLLLLSVNLLCALFGSGQGADGAHRHTLSSSSLTHELASRRQNTHINELVALVFLLGQRREGERKRANMHFALTQTQMKKRATQRQNTMAFALRPPRRKPFYCERGKARNETNRERP